MGTTRRSGRRRASTLAAVAAVLALAAGCASSVAGTAEPVAGRPAIPTAPVSTGPGSPAPDTTDPGTTKPETTEPGTTEPGTTESETSEPETTEPETTAPDTSEPDTSAPVTGVPAPASQFLRKKLNEDAGIADAGNIRVFTFRVVEIVPDFRSRCDGGTPAPERGHLIGVRLRYEVLDAYAPAEDGQILLDRAAFQVRDGADVTHDDLDSTAAETCLPKSRQMPDEPLTDGATGGGWVVLDAPISSGVVQLTQESIGSGGWEWVIPGS